jgi:hypothetical protein
MLKSSLFDYPRLPAAVLKVEGNATSIKSVNIL